MSQGSLIDVAGAFEGGAARYLRELDLYIADARPPSLSVVGRGRRLTPSWLLVRETQARSSHTVAVNNASFVGGVSRTVILRNALHFSTERELSELDFKPSAQLRLQTPVIRRLTQRADHIVVPCTAMAERVADLLPTVSDRLHVKFHPLSITASPRLERRQDRILMPIVNSSYKQLQHHVAALRRAMDHLGTNLTLAVTGYSEEYPVEMARDPQVEFIGKLPSTDLDAYWRSATAIYFPTRIESFGYPLAESRVRGIPVLAEDSAQSHEVAGPALFAFARGSESSLASALEGALSARLEPDPAPFARNDYFEWLIGLARST